MPHSLDSTRAYLRAVRPRGLTAPIAEVIAAFEYVARKEGWRSAVATAVQHFIEYERSYVLSARIDELAIYSPTIERALARGVIKTRLATLDDLPLFEQIVPLSKTRRFARLMASGELCMLALKGDKLVGFEWAAQEGNPTARAFPVPIEPKEVYVWGAEMPNEYRALGWMVMTHASLYRLLQKQGFERVTGYVHQQNEPSWKMLRGLGFKIVSELVMLRVLKWKIARCAPYTEP